MLIVFSCTLVVFLEILFGESWENYAAGDRIEWRKNVCVAVWYAVIFE
jgi:hypothetical protein